MFLSKFMLKQQAAATIYQAQRATFVMFKGDKFSEKGKGEEEVYFSQQERNVLKKLLSKMDSDTQKARDHFESSSSDEETFVPTNEKKKAEAKAQDTKLHGIFETHGIKDDSKLMKALKDWKANK
mmetsp:Transcript_24651/g.21880  ORF Transcript_24651/g.21880 Transcript_24651/m.21880 type:complete len:125 (+) Transcript_24651:187-561(+)